MQALVFFRERLLCSNTIQFCLCNLVFETFVSCIFSELKEKKMSAILLLKMGLWAYVMALVKHKQSLRCVLCNPEGGMQLYPIHNCIWNTNDFSTNSIFPFSKTYKPYLPHSIPWL